MEDLKSLIPNNLKEKISNSTVETLTDSCSSLLDFLLPLPQFQRVIEDLTDPALALCRKSRERALEFKKQGNECFSKGDYEKALKFYSKALRYSPMTNSELDEDFVALLYVNRASSMHKIGLLEECIRDCNRAIVLSPSYAKAWYRRGKANASLKYYEAAASDIKISLRMEGSSSGKKQIKEELNEIQNHLNSTTGKTHLKNSGKRNEVIASDEICDIKLQCVTTPLKGRGMVSPTDIRPSSLLHSEEPLAAIVLKSCRETHCHFCFNEVPADVVFCLSCTIPIYCSQHCQEQSGGKLFVGNRNPSPLQKDLPANLANHFKKITLAGNGRCDVIDDNFKHIHEHRHECGGAHWPAVLPPEVVLAGRVMVMTKERKEDLMHNYNQTLPDDKLELHLYAIVLSYCLQHDSCFDFQSACSSSSKLVLLISQIKVNSMAIVRMISLDGRSDLEKPAGFFLTHNYVTSSVEQVQVGKAIYTTGSLFNHSCQPNIHAYFLSRTLFLRSTEFVPACNPLELSYGPQVGQLSFQERQGLLKDRYSFICHCKGCSELNLSDIVINAFCCLEPNCLGAVLDIDHHRRLQEALQKSTTSFRWTPLLQEEDIIKVAGLLLQNSGVVSNISPEHCLTCGSFRDLESLKAPSKSAMDINKLEGCLHSEATGILELNTLTSLRHLRSVWHPYSKIVAQAEDTIAEAFVSVGEFKPAMLHCKTSIETLEKLYGTNHIVIGHELLKLVSIQLSLGDHTSALCSIQRLCRIFSLYYGSHASVIFPYIDDLTEDISN